ncbi:MAG: hypothetical protein COW85_15440 [Ignavibacteria bacterium CG22_combo_CG10-13_8_21_14_all_37_15]|nr:MAG: hypothetical protein COW85_15440 [Ignavibacteria bacterium CG22_combo_CG10-13_8_21_14_all_37_15]PIQ10439.1 MAG: hypothetical protein COW71_02760 [Ignavibacteriales bacterium CG18_big_fil_WC_8_21_14_2_50_31_20]
MTNTNSPQSFLIHDSKTLPEEFIKEFEKLLSTSLPVKRIDVSKRINHSPLSLNWLEIALIFASATFAKSFLNEFGKDVYGLIKRKIIERLNRNETKKNKSGFKEMRITISINATDVFVQGRVISADYYSIIDAIKVSKQMVSDAIMKKKLLNKKIKFNEVEGLAKQTPVFEPGIWFDYEYDLQKKEWILKRITNYKPDSKSGQFYASEGEQDRVVM